MCILQRCCGGTGSSNVHFHLERFLMTPRWHPMSIILKSSIARHLRKGEKRFRDWLLSQRAVQEVNRNGDVTDGDILLASHRLFVLSVHSRGLDSRIRFSPNSSGSKTIRSWSPTSSTGAGARFTTVNGASPKEMRKSFLGDRWEEKVQ
ncbi:hypothetical protein TNCV_3623191 [Trichonephila clavipes]|nr:hypothetical protein TNCV_3623191 [Trichonephila clavipes]